MPQAQQLSQDLTPRLARRPHKRAGHGALRFAAAAASAVIQRQAAAPVWDPGLLGELPLLLHVLLTSMLAAPTWALSCSISGCNATHMR
jgi:hypothetical protein